MHFDKRGIEYSQMTFGLFHCPENKHCYHLIYDSTSSHRRLGAKFFRTFKPYVNCLFANKTGRWLHAFFYIFVIFLYLLLRLIADFFYYIRENTFD